jgi:protein O-GlcNAc transferase
VSIERALQLEPTSADALTRRGDALMELDRTEEALANYNRALQIEPARLESMYQRGNALRNLKRTEEALASYDRALEIQPDNADAVTVRANALLELKCLEEALAEYDGALRIRPNFAPALFNRGLTLHELARYEEAARSFARVLEIDPEFEDAPGKLHHMKLLSGDWSRWDEDVARIDRMVSTGRRAGDPFDLLGVLGSPEVELRCARAAVSARFPRGETVLWPGFRPAHDRIRVAYLSADFGEHAVSHVAAGLFEHHDRSRFETVGIALRTEQRPSPMRRRLQQAFEQFHDVSAKTDREAAALLRDLEVDIAVDLNGHTSGGRPGILALRPVPVQVNYLGFPGTFGADYIDYIIADAVVIPAGEEPAYAEHIVRLPHAYLPYDNRLEVAPDTPSRTEAGLPQSGFVFCAFNNGYKITPAMFDIWMRLLNRIPDSVLWLRATNPAMVRNLGREATARGVAPQRLVFAPKTDVMARHLARHRLAGLFLDTLPYNAHSTAADALWAGLPVLTCQGPTFAGRVAASLLRAVGLPELITHSLEEYEALAYTLATTPPMLADIRNRLAANRTTYPLFDTDRLRRHLESAYLTMWNHTQRGEPPQGLSIRAMDS